MVGQNLHELWETLYLNPSIHRNKLAQTHLQKFAPVAKKAKPIFQDDIPVCECHVQVQGFLTSVLGIVEGELVKVLKLGTIGNFSLQTRQFLLQFVQ